MALTITVIIIVLLAANAVREVVANAPKRRRKRLLKNLGLDLIPRDGWGDIGAEWPEGQNYRVCKIIGWNQTGYTYSYGPMTKTCYSRNWRVWPTLSDDQASFATIGEVDEYLVQMTLLKDRVHD